MKQKDDDSNQPLSLPKMQKSQYYTISDSDFSDRPEALHQTMKVYKSNEIQSIGSNDIKAKSF